MKVSSKHCENCNVQFKPNDYRQKYCSRSCAAQVNNRLSPKRKNYNKRQTCLECDAQLNYHQNRFCSAACMGRNNSKTRIDLWISGQSILSDSTLRSGDNYRSFVLSEQSHRCAICGMIDEWNGQPLTFIFDHIDGNSENNTRENVRLVCPNCNIQLPTSNGKNKGSGRKSRYLKRQLEREALGVAF